MFSKIVKIKLLEKDMSRQELCEKLGCTTANLSQLLSVDNLREKKMFEIAEALDCDLKFVLTDRHE